MAVPNKVPDITLCSEVRPGVLTWTRTQNFHGDEWCVLECQTDRNEVLLLAKQYRATYQQDMLTG